MVSNGFSIYFPITSDTNGTLVNQRDQTQSTPYTINFEPDSGENASNISLSPTIYEARGQVTSTFGIDVNINPDSSLPYGDYQTNITIACAFD